MKQNTAENILKSGYGRAEELVRDADKTEAFLLRLEEKLRLLPKVGDSLACVPVFISMVRSCVRREYPQLPLGSLIAIVSALLYFLSPVDLIPDLIPVAGYADDAAVLAACLTLVSSDVKEYELWRKHRAEK